MASKSPAITGFQQGQLNIIERALEGNKIQEALDAYTLIVKEQALTRKRIEISYESRDQANLALKRAEEILSISDFLKDQIKIIKLKAEQIVDSQLLKEYENLGTQREKSTTPPHLQLVA